VRAFACAGSCAPSCDANPSGPPFYDLLGCRATRGHATDDADAGDAELEPPWRERRADDDDASEPPPRELYGDVCAPPPSSLDAGDDASVQLRQQPSRAYGALVSVRASCWYDDDDEVLQLSLLPYFPLERLRRECRGRMERFS
jgi:hypothetical protein